MQNPQSRDHTTSRAPASRQERWLYIHERVIPKAVLFQNPAAGLRLTWATLDYFGQDRLNSQQRFHIFKRHRKLEARREQFCSGIRSSTRRHNLAYLFLGGPFNPKPKGRALHLKPEIEERGRGIPIRCRTVYVTDIEL